MLNTPAPYPYVGSYGLLETDDRESPRTELIRIVFRREGFTTVSFPLREGASGNREVAEDALIDGTPLTREEMRVLAELDRDLARRKLRNDRWRWLSARRDRLKMRAQYAPLLIIRMRELNGTPWTRSEPRRAA